MSEFTLRPATAEDIPHIMEIERLPGYRELVGHFSQNEHQANFADDSYRHYLLCLGPGRVVGFAVLTGYGHPWGVINIHRIAVRPGERGTGTRFTRMVCDEIFSDPLIFRIALDVLPGNIPARRAYERVGFAAEGLMRSALRYPDGRRSDLLLMSLLRPDWEAASVG